MYRMAVCRRGREREGSGSLRNGLSSLQAKSVLNVRRERVMAR